MSDLHCPATLLVLRHGQAVYEDTDLLDDRAGGHLTATGRDQARSAAAVLAGRNVRAVWASSRGRAVETATIITSLIGVPLTVDADLRELEIGDLARLPSRQAWPPLLEVYNSWVHGDLDVSFPCGEDGHALIRRVHGALQQVADLHRGETVAVVTHGGAMSVALPRLADNLPDDWADGREIENTEMVELQVDGDGWRCVEWIGTRI